jgi:hypothetical protein
MVRYGIFGDVVGPTCQYRGYIRGILILQFKKKLIFWSGWEIYSPFGDRHISVCGPSRQIGQMWIFEVVV